MSLEHRRRYKNDGKVEEMRRRRVETSIELRKRQKEEQLMKRRNIEPCDILSSPEEVSVKDVNEEDRSDTLLLNCLATFLTGNIDELLKPVKMIRQLLSRPVDPPINKVIISGAIPYLIKFLEVNIPDLQYESAWALTNVLSGSSEQTMQVVNMGVISPLINLLGSSSECVAQQSVWALANIAGDCAKLRDMVIDLGAIPHFLQLVEKPISVDFLKTLSWAISNLCRSKNPVPSTNTVTQLMPALIRLLNNEDHEVVADACWAFSYISDGSEDRIDLVLQSGMLSRIVALAHCSHSNVVPPALRALGNIVTGNDRQTQMVVDTGILKTLMPLLLRSSKKAIVKEACWLISNVAAGTTDQMQEILNSGIMSLVIELLSEGDFRTQVEATWVVYNIATAGKDQQIDFLVTLGVLPALCNFLKRKDPKILGILLDAIYDILEASVRNNKLDLATLSIEECGGLDIIENLQNDVSDEIYAKSLHIIEKFFSSEVTKFIDEN